MTGLVRKAALLGACGLFIASIAGAAVPDPAHSSLQRAANGNAYIRMGGMQSPVGAGVPDPSIAYTITVRDFLNNPIGGSTVEINYVQCADSYLCQAIVAGQNVDCAGEAVRAATNAAGQVTVSILGGGKHTGSIPPAVFPGANNACIRVYADGIQIGTAFSVIYDLNGARPGNNGVAGSDVSAFLNDVGAYAANPALNYKGRSDYFHDGAVDGADVAAYVVGNNSVVGRSASGTGSAAGCYGNGPGGVAVAQPYCP